MRRKISVIITSLIFAMLIMSGGYGYWSGALRVQGEIEVYPDKDIVDQTRDELMDLKRELIEQQMALEAQQVTDTVTMQEINNMPSTESTNPLDSVGESDGVQNNNPLQPVEFDDTTPGEQDNTGEQLLEPVDTFIEDNKDEEEENVVKEPEHTDGKETNDDTEENEEEPVDTFIGNSEDNKDEEAINDIEEYEKELVNGISSTPEDGN